MKNIITIGGSSSKNSINKQLAEYAGSLINDVELINIDIKRLRFTYIFHRYRERKRISRRPEPFESKCGKC